jgi:hypothetical protein
MGRQEEMQASAGRAGLPLTPGGGETWQWARGSGREGCVAGNVDCCARSLQVWGGEGSTMLLLPSEVWREDAESRVGGTARPLCPGKGLHTTGINSKPKGLTVN